MPIKSLLGAAILMLALPAAINAQTKITSAELGGTKNVHQRDNLYFGGQFSPSDIATLQAKDIKRVVTLRTDGEVDWDEEAALKQAGIEFSKIPFGSPEQLTDNVFDRTRELFKDKSQATLLHCGSANRVGSVWLPYRVLDEGASIETALAEAKEIGLRAPSLQEKALDYIRRKQSPSVNGEASVKPGINKKFVDPNLDVDQWVKKLELESREVFLHRERILAACQIHEGDTVADIGAGTGLFSRMFSSVVGDQGSVFAVDISARFIEYINRESTRKKINNITGVVCAENSVNLPRDSVDLVFVCDTYHHFEYPKSTLASIHRALKNDGHLVVVDFERIEGKSRKWTMGHVRAGKEVFQTEIENAGFKLVAQEQVDGLEENYFLKFRKN
jgi:ubiquinone/menaquinone biosynthesis C-methylase UbiE/protein tyrosine phosphatase (PTP) superfamily phosphohydrolase (DUF442 family)